MITVGPSETRQAACNCKDHNEIRVPSSPRHILGVGSVAYRDGGGLGPLRRMVSITFSFLEFLYMSAFGLAFSRELLFSVGRELN